MRKVILNSRFIDDKTSVLWKHSVGYLMEIIESGKGPKIPDGLYSISGTDKETDSGIITIYYDEAKISLNDIMSFVQSMGLSSEKVDDGFT